MPRRIVRKIFKLRRPAETPELHAALPRRKGEAKPRLGPWKKAALAGVAVAIALATLYIRSGHGFGIDYLKANYNDLVILVQERHVLVLLAFTVVYTLYVGIMLPGTAVLSLAGGALFGLWEGMAVVGLARVLGAVMAMLLARYFLRDWVVERHGPFIAKLNNALERDGAYYLFFLRMAPVVPYNLTNLGMGITDMPVFTYSWVTLIGMFPRAFLWVNAGNQVVNVTTFQDVVSPSVAVSLAALGVFPLAMKWVFSLVEKRRAAKRQRP